MSNTKIIQLFLLHPSPSPIIWPQVLSFIPTNIRQLASLLFFAYSFRILPVFWSWICIYIGNASNHYVVPSPLYNHLFSILCLDACLTKLPTLCCCFFNHSGCLKLVLYQISMKVSQNHYINCLWSLYFKSLCGCMIWDFWLITSCPVLII